MPAACRLPTPSRPATRIWTSLDDIGEIDLHISGCINSCGHHHSGHIGILGVDKDGKEWYQVTLGGSDGSTLSGQAVAGKVIGPSFSAAEVPDVIEAVLSTYRDLRQPGEHFIDAVRRIGLDPSRRPARPPATLWKPKKKRWPEAIRTRIKS